MSQLWDQLGMERLTSDERLALVEEILASIPVEPPGRPELTEAKRAELGRRLIDHETNPNDVVPWEEVEAAALARLTR